MFNMKLFIWVDNTPSKSQRPSNKNSPTRQENLSSHLMVRAIQEIPKAYSLLLLYLIASTRWKENLYCWKHQAFQGQGPVAPEAEMTWMPLLEELAFIVPDAFKQASKERTHTQDTYPVMTTMNQQH